MWEIFFNFWDNFVTFFWCFKRIITLPLHYTLRVNSIRDLIIRIFSETRIEIEMLKSRINRTNSRFFTETKTKKNRNITNLNFPPCFKHFLYFCDNLFRFFCLKTPTSFFFFSFFRHIHGKHSKIRRKKNADKQTNRK